MDIYRQKNKGTTVLSPHSAFANQIMGNRTQREQLALRLFLKQKAGISIYPSKTELEIVADLCKPRNTKFTLYLRDDITFSRPLKTYTPPKAPVKPGKSMSDVATAKDEYNRQLKEYRRKLDPPVYKSKFPQFPEAPMPDNVAICENYDNCLASALVDLSTEIGEKI